MARTGAVWGIDIGQCALKALRCRPHEDAGRVQAEAFDYIEYPKILSQPEADPVELVREALKTFLSRNSVRGDRVAISVSGQSGLARFIKLPPVDFKKIPDIVKYEARQQIPFALEDVIWDYQQMAGGSVEEGFALETEVGLFAMKRDQVFRAIKPLTDAGIEVDVVQLTPLTIYNFVEFDQLTDLPPADQYDPEDPPESTVVLSLGTDTTDLVITNGFRVWNRSIPIGGNHFTKALTKELKLTFAKAEHLKRNATKAEDPKAVFQAMRPVFSDLLTEINRSITYFGNVDRNAKISRVLPLGNAIKLPGLQKYLAQNLELEIIDLEAFRTLSGSPVTESPVFKENLPSFGVAYGLALQALGKGKLRTNLVPPEMLKDRMIREKKPWAVAAVAALLAGCMVGYLGHWSAWKAVDPERYTSAFNAASDAKSQSSRWVTEFDGKKEEREKILGIGKGLTQHVERRMLWIEFLKAFSQLLPKETAEPKPPISQREEIHIVSMECQPFEDLSVWYEEIKPMLSPGQTPTADGSAPVEEPTETDMSDSEEGEDGESTEGPTGAGYIVQIQAYHYHNAEQGNQGLQFVRNTLMKNLEEAIVTVPTPNGKQSIEVPVKELGIGYPVLVRTERNRREVLLEPGAEASSMTGPGMGPGAGPGVRPGAGPRPLGGRSPMGAARPGAGRPGAAGSEDEEPEGPKEIILERTDFTLQFCWKPTTYTERLEAARKAAEEKANEEQAPSEDLADNSAAQ